MSGLDEQDDREPTKYLVELWNFRATDLSGVRKDGLSNPFVRVNFDNYKILRTNTAKKTLQPDRKSVV